MNYYPCMFQFSRKQILKRVISIYFIGLFWGSNTITHGKRVFLKKKKTIEHNAKCKGVVVALNLMRRYMKVTNRK